MLHLLLYLISNLNIPLQPNLLCSFLKSCIIHPNILILHRLHYLYFPRPTFSLTSPPLVYTLFITIWMDNDIPYPRYLAIAVELGNYKAKAAMTQWIEGPRCQARARPVVQQGLLSLARSLDYKCSNKLDIWSGCSLGNTTAFWLLGVSPCLFWLSIEYCCVWVEFWFEFGSGS